MGRPQSLHLVLLTPGGILAELMLYFLPQYRQAISRIPDSDAAGFADLDMGAAASVAGFKEIAWPQALQRVLVTPWGMALDLILNCWLQYWQLICTMSDGIAVLEAL